MPKTILVVDDSIAMRLQVSIALKQSGFLTVEAADGQEGLAVVDSNRNIAMVICDVNMPKMDGIEMVKQIKSKPEHQSLPIVMLTTGGDVSLVRRAKHAGAVGWIVKPFKRSQLVQTVTQLIDLIT